MSLVYRPLLAILCSSIDNSHVLPAAFNIGFITHLFEIVEQTRDGDERYNYALIRLIVRCPRVLTSV